MRDEDQPPEAIWLDGDALKAHFDRLKEKYKNKGDDETPDLTQNELTKNLRRAS